MARLVSFDPGGTTGWALFQHHDGEVPILVAYGQSPHWTAVRSLLYTDQDPTDTVVYEKFKLFPQEAAAQIGSQFIASQVIGVIRFLCELQGIEIVGQEPMGSTNTFFSDKRIIEYGWVEGRFKRHEMRHALDAIRHGLHYLHFALKYDVSRGRNQQHG